jgi:hypothetical protein
LEFFVIQQAVYGSVDAGGYRFLARSPGFGDVWLAEAERLCTSFGERPAGVSCPACVFARPFLAGFVAVVQAADQGSDDAGRPGALAFRILVVPAVLYRDLGGDPFFIADAFPPPWQARGDLPELTWTADPAPPRTVAELRGVIDVPSSPTLLGGVQALLDGGRLAFERPAPDTPLLRSLWALLPTQSRAELWPASFCFSNRHGFHAVVVPRVSGPEFANYIPEGQVGDYPEGRYELALQVAIEQGNQDDLDALLSRRSRSQMVRLAVGLLAVTVLVALASAFFNPPPRQPPPTTAQRPHKAAAMPEQGDWPELLPAERENLAVRLQDLGKRLGITMSAKSTNDDLEHDLAALDARLKTPDPDRDPGPLAALGPIQRQLRTLLWKHHVKDYNDRRLNTVELVERLQQHLAEKGLLKEDAGG